MNHVIRFFESTLVAGILVVLLVVLLAAFVDIAYEIYLKIMAPPALVIDARGLMELFSLVLVLLIGLELVETVKAYLKEDVVHVAITVWIMCCTPDIFASTSPHMP